LAENTTLNFNHYLVDKIEVKNGKIIFTHKKTSLGEITTAKYEKPIEIEITEMERNNTHY
jgi:hypothetical protein